VDVGRTLDNLVVQDRMRMIGVMEEVVSDGSFLLLTTEAVNLYISLLTRTSYDNMTKAG